MGKTGCFSHFGGTKNTYLQRFQELQEEAKNDFMALGYGITPTWRRTRVRYL